MTRTASTKTAADRPRSQHSESAVAPVDVWLGQVDHPVDHTSRAWLDAAELARADRFSFDRDRDRFINRRALVRAVLARYLESPPADIQIRVASHGRPELAGGGDLSFNVSHSDGLALVAVAYGHSVGVDIERLRPVPDGLELARGLFHQRELEALESVPESQRSAAFLAIWTRKEAIVKADGRGLSIPLDRFDVLPLDGHDTGRPRGQRGNLPFVFTDLRASDDWIGAVVLDDQNAMPRVALLEAP